VNPAFWTDEELDRIGAAEELELATLGRVRKDVREALLISVVVSVVVRSR
jgi:hypothetical protein